MIAASGITIFIVPVLFVLITKVSYGKTQLPWLQAHHEDLMEMAREADVQNIDAKLEFEIARDRSKDDENNRNDVLPGAEEKK
jgi:hydrophobic/amphiphilic exporter-1 (mainly G- bacteria), HAE1 family